MASDLPSGQRLALWQISWERIEGRADLQLVVRALAPDLGAMNFDAAQADMDWICATHGAPIAALPHANATQVVVNLSNKPVTRGVTDPTATQFFGLYRLENDACIWEDY